MLRLYPEEFLAAVPVRLRPADPPPSPEELQSAQRARADLLLPGEAEPYMDDIVRAFRLVKGSRAYVEIGTYAGGIRMQQVLADGSRALAVMRGVGSASGPLALVNLTSGDVIRTLVPDVVEGWYTAGYLMVVLNNGSFLAIPFDERRGEVTGTAVTVAGGVSVIRTPNISAGNSPHTACVIGTKWPRCRSCASSNMSCWSSTAPAGTPAACRRSISEQASCFTVSCASAASSSASC